MALLAVAVCFSCPSSETRNCVAAAARQTPDKDRDRDNVRHFDSRTNSDNDTYKFRVFEDCPGGGVTIERIVQVNANRLLWIQVRATDLGTANDVIASIETRGL